MIHSSLNNRVGYLEGQECYSILPIKHGSMYRNDQEDGETNVLGTVEMDGCIVLSIVVVLFLR